MRGPEFEAHLLKDHGWKKSRLENIKEWIPDDGSVRMVELMWHHTADHGKDDVTHTHETLGRVVDVVAEEPSPPTKEI